LAASFHEHPKTSFATKDTKRTKEKREGAADPEAVAQPPKAATREGAYRQQAGP
jgi:hypothetical protein